MKIDTSTTEGKIEVMLKEVEGCEIQQKIRVRSTPWYTRVSSVSWNWSELDYRAVPETVEDAADSYRRSFLGYDICPTERSRYTSFIVGAKWQKEQDQ